VSVDIVKVDILYVNDCRMRRGVPMKALHFWGILGEILQKMGVLLSKNRNF
jgi:hypothetical protein